MAKSSLLGRLGWFWNRLRCMPPGEPAYRIWQAVLFKLEQSGLMPLDAGATATTPPLVTTWPIPDVDPAPYLLEADAIIAGQVILFASSTFDVGAIPNWNRDPLTGTVAPLAFGPGLQITDPTVVGDIKHIWELNRHLHLVRLAQAYCLSGDTRYAQALAVQLRSWLDQCTPLCGPNWSSSLELGIRLINWSLIWQFMGGSSGVLFLGEDGRTLHDDWLASIFAHCQFIARHCSRHSSANNHLIGELSGLYVAARCWPCWGQSAVWAQRARRELEEQAVLQHTEDGVNREQAYSYQIFTVEFLLIAGLAGQRSADPYAPSYWTVLRRALHFAAAVRNVSGYAPMYGDADDGIVFRLEPGATVDRAGTVLAVGAACLDGVLPERSNASAAWLLGASSRGQLAPSSLENDWNFLAGGYLLFGSDFGLPSEIKGMVDCGTLGYLGIAAHGHADALAVTLSIGGEPCLIDPGTYSYWKDLHWRDYFRGTSAHNTLRIDGLDQSVSGGRFMWTRKAQVFVERQPTSAQQFDFQAAHDGYQRISDPVRHSRQVRFDAITSTLLVRDDVEACHEHCMEQFWHFAPGLVLTLNGMRLTVRGQRFVMQVEFSGVEIELALIEGQELPPLGWYSRNYEEKVPSPTLVVRAQKSGGAIQAQFKIDAFK